MFPPWSAGFCAYLYSLFQVVGPGNFLAAKLTIVYKALLPAKGALEPLRRAALKYGAIGPRSPLSQNFLFGRLDEKKADLVKMRSLDCSTFY
jgi:hypothetical protein